MPCAPSASIVLVFLTVPVFFALYNQVNSTWVLQGEKDDAV